MSSTIFNVAVDEVVRNWVLMVAVYAGGPAGWGREVIHHKKFFYVDGSLVASTDPEYLQGELKTIISFCQRGAPYQFW